MCPSDPEQPAPEAVAMAQDSLKEAIKGEQPIHLSKAPLMEGAFAQIMRKAQRENKRNMHFMNAKENFKFCRKRCKLFKCRECFKKTFEEQKACYESGGYNNPTEGETK